MDNIIITQAADHEKEALCFFLNNALEHRMTQEDFKWEYEARKHDSVFTVIKSDDKYLGSQGFIPIDLVAGKKVLLTNKSENSFLDPSLRGRGMFERLYEFGLEISKDRGHQLCWGFTALIKVWRDKLGFYVDTDSIYEALLVLRPFGDSKNNGYKRILYYIYQLGSSILNWGKIISIVRKNKLRVVDNLLDNSDLESFFSQFDKQNAYLIRLQYKWDYIKWRTQDIPASRYKSIYLYDENELNAFAFLNITDKKHVYISDIMFDSDESAFMLFGEIIRLARKYNTLTLRYFGNRKNNLCSKIFTMLEKAGAKVYLNKNMNFVLRKLSDEDCEECFKIENWYITGLFTEGYKI